MRLLELDALRGIAAVGVVSYHYLYRYAEVVQPSAPKLEWFFYGTFGVQLFFMISGFVIYWSLQNVERPIDFLKSRFARLYPAFWAALILAFLVMSVFGSPLEDVSIKDFLLNFLMFHQLFDVPHVDPVYWTLTIELLFYLWMFMLLTAKKLGWAVYIFAGLVGLAALDDLSILSVGDGVRGILILSHLPFFLIGICLFMVSNRLADRATYAALVLCVLGILVGFPPLQAMVVLALVGVFCAATLGYGRFLAWRPLLFFGEISYSLYLVHQIVGYVILINATSVGVPFAFAVTLAFTVSVGIACILRRYIEVPAGQILRRSLG